MERLSPESRCRLKTYVAEADFFEAVLSKDLDTLAAGSRLIEIGSGIGLLSLRLAEKGFTVKAYEPESSGFSEMFDHREIIKTSWLGVLPNVEWCDTYLSAGTDLSASEMGVFAFAVNVLEHVPDIESFIAAAVRSLVPGGRFRFICPNYSFPYEPHFEIPTLLNKELTYRIFQKKILASTVDEPKGTWDELSWPNVWKLSRTLRRMGVRHSFSRAATEFYLLRVTDDPTFLARKSRAVGAMFRLGSAAAPKIVGLVPNSLLPIIDCTVYRDGLVGGHGFRVEMR